MEKNFTHNGTQYTARTKVDGEAIQIGIFNNGEKRVYLMSMTREIFEDMQKHASFAETSLEQWLGIVIQDFTRLIDEAS